jgi:hypothetical protein
VDELVALAYYDTVPSTMDTFTTVIVIVIELKRCQLKSYFENIHGPHLIHIRCTACRHVFKWEKGPSVDSTPPPPTMNSFGGRAAQRNQGWNRSILGTPGFELDASVRDSVWWRISGNRRAVSALESRKFWRRGVGRNSRTIDGVAVLPAVLNSCYN